MQRSVFGQPGRPDERRKLVTCRVRSAAGWRAAGRRCAPMNSTGWFCRFCPTPGRSARTAIPSDRSAAAGPIPERSSSVGDWMPPAAQDDFARTELAGLAGDRGFHADRAPAVEHDLGGRRLLQDGQVLARPHVAHRDSRAPTTRGVAANCSSAARNSRRGSRRSCRRPSPSAGSRRIHARHARAASSSRGRRGGSGSVRRVRAVRRRSRDRSRACGRRAARRPRPSRRANAFHSS